MNHRKLTLLAPLLAAAACAPVSGGGGSPEPSSYEDTGGPLRARLEGATGRLHVVTSDPAHIAVFEIVPGRGVGLVYPLTERDEYRQFAGSGWLPPSHMRSSHWFYDAGLPFYQPYAGPARFYLLVASRAPLYTRRYRYSPASLRTTLGFDYASYNETAVLTRLVENIVPAQQDGDWTTDILAVWPSPSYADQYQRRMIRVVCGDGRVNVVPFELARFACPDRNPSDVPPPNDSTGGGGTVVERPGGRRPRPGEVTVPVDGEEALLPEGSNRRVPGRRVLPPATDGGEPTTEEPRGRPGVGEVVETGANPPSQPDGEQPVIRRRPVETGTGRGGDGTGATPRRRPDTRDRLGGADVSVPRGSMPRREAPQAETPRRVSPRSETPRSESPRSETPRSESPRSYTPPPQPSYTPPAAPAPAPRSMPATGGGEATPG